MPKSALGKPSKEFGPKHKLFGAALRMTAMEMADEVRADKEVRAETNLRRAAAALMAKALTGDVPALKEVADRLDGRVPQGIVGDDENPLNIIHKIERTIVRPKAQDG